MAISRMVYHVLLPAPFQFAWYTHASLAGPKLPVAGAMRKPTHGDRHRHGHAVAKSETECIADFSAGIYYSIAVDAGHRMDYRLLAESAGTTAGSLGVGNCHAVHGYWHGVMRAL